MRCTKWGLLAAAIVSEVAATLSLRASQDDGVWLILVLAGYAASFGMFTLVLRAGMAVGVAYGIWGAAGTASTAYWRQSSSATPSPGRSRRA